MALFRDRLQSIWSYVSPRKTVERRDKEFKVPAKPIKSTPLKRRVETPESREMSPESRIKSWKVRTPSPQSDLDGDLDMDHTLLPPSPPTSAKLMEDFEGDTLVASPSVHASDKTGASAEEWNANEDTIAVDDGNFMDTTIDVMAEKQRREEQGRQLRKAGWPADAVFLFQKLGLRGMEPLLLMDWVNDLDTLPEYLFTAKEDRAFLRPAHGSSYRAQQALSSLFDLGGRARDANLTKAPKRKPEYHIKRAVQQYTSWAMKDGAVDHLWASLPLFEVVTWPKTVHAAEGEQKMCAKLGKLYNKWYKALDIQKAEDRGDKVVPEVPTLYGVTASHTIMAFVSYGPPSADKQQPQLRLIAMFDFGKDGYEVWHALAIAIFVTHCRNRMMQLKEMLPEQQLSTKEDPDL